MRLKYDTPGITHKHHVGTDPGRENIGLSVSKDDGECVYLEDMETHNRNIKKEMADRKTNRVGRRRHDRQSKQRKAVHDSTEIKNGDDDICRTKHPCKAVKMKYPGADNPVTHKIIRGKEGKFNNRARMPGWVTNSARQLVQLTIIDIERMCRMFPVTDVHIERNAFDFQRLANTSIHDWNHGPLYGFKNYKEAIFTEQKGKCLLCGAPITNYHHIHEQNCGKDKYDHLSNIAGLCSACHDKVHKDSSYAENLSKLKEGSYQKFQVGLLNSVIPLVLDTLSDWCKQRGIRLHITDGQTTAATRHWYGLQKDHCVDAYAISLVNRKPKRVKLPDYVYHSERFKKKQNAMTSKVGSRQYVYDGKAVAANRHKAEGQKSDSLEEYLTKYAETHTRYETVRHAHELEVVPARRTYTYRKDRLTAPVHKGDVIEVVKTNKKGQVVSRTKDIADTVRMCGEGSVHGISGKTYTLKFVRRIGSGSVQVTGRTDTKTWLKQVRDEQIKFAKKKVAAKKGRNTGHKSPISSAA